MSTSEPHILIVDDNREIRDGLSRYMRANGYRATAAESAAAARRVLKTNGIDLAVVDVMMTGEDGLNLTRGVRAESALPIILLTARGDDVDRIIGLELGADDYLPKPFNQRELVARIRAILRRSTRGAAPAPVQPTVLQLGDLEMDLARRQTTLGGKTVTLTGLEFELLRVFLGAAGQVVSRQDIAREVFHRPMLAMDRTLSVHVCSLRRKLGDAPRGGERIKTVHGVGYIYLPPSDPFDGAM